MRWLVAGPPVPEVAGLAARGPLEFPWTNRWRLPPPPPPPSPPPPPPPYSLVPSLPGLPGASINYFRQLDLARIHRLFAVYRLDFEMFDYSASEYLNLFM